MSEKSEESLKARKWTQIAATVVAALGTFCGGTSLSWSAPALPSLQSDICGDDCDVNLTEDEASWVSALMPAGAIVGGFVAGWLMNAVGRRWTMCLCSLPYLLGNFFYVVSHEIDNEDAAKWLIYTGRMLTGFSASSFFLVGTVFVVEISESHLRGRLSALNMSSLALGMVFVNGMSINDALRWNTISAVCIAFPVLTIIGLQFVHESPRYLISRDLQVAASKSLHFYRGPDYNIDQELQTLSISHKEEQEIGSISLKTLLTRRVYLRPFLLVLLLMFVQQAGGINVVSFYVQVIFEDAGSDLDPGLSGFLVSLAQLFGNLVAVALVDRYGRKILLVTSAIVMGASLFSLGTFFYIKDNACYVEDCDGFDEETVEDLGWLPLASLVVYMLGFAVGLGVLPYAVAAEIFLPESRSLSASLATAFNWLTAFTVVKLDSDLENWIGTGETYFVYATVCVVGAGLMVLLLPETKGKTPQEIAEKFRKKEK